jgi:hypothetical protein
LREDGGGRGPPAAGYRGEDFNDHAALPHIVSLLEQNSRLAAQKAEEWLREAQLQEALLDGMDDDYNF